MEEYAGRYCRERGAILVHTAISILMLTAFTAFVVDYGVLWVARGQAQNAADAGALAGATALAFDDVTNPPSTTVPLHSATWAARGGAEEAGWPTTAPLADPVWSAQTGSSSAINVSFVCPAGFSGRCVR